MNALVTITGGSAASTMTSKEVAELTGKRHDHVMRDIRVMLSGLYGAEEIEAAIPTKSAEEQFFEFIGAGLPSHSPKLGDDVIQGVTFTRDARGYVGEFRLNYSLTMTLVSGYEVKLRKAIIDRWQELEKQAALGAFNLPKSMSEALRLAADQADRIEALEHQAAEDAPKVAALERFASHEGQHNVRNAAKLLGVRERLFTAWLIAHDWMYRDHSGRLCAKSGRLSDGCLDTVPVEVQRSTGIHTYPQPFITQKGLARLAVLLARDGLIPKEAA